jgi:hypothetical protein
MRLGRKHIREIIIIRDFVRITFNTLHTISKWPQLHSSRFLCTSQAYSRAVEKFTVSPRPSNSLLAILRNILELEEWTIGMKSLSSDSIGNDKGRNRYL